MEYDFLSASLHIRNVNPNRLRLSDSIQTSDALFHQGRVQRQIKENQVVAELEIASLGTDFRSDHQHRSTLVGKARRRPVPSEN